MNYVKGDLIKLAKKDQFDVIIHGCNCFCTMGAGIAKQIKKEFPEAYKVDNLTKRGDRSKLGSYSFVKLDNLIIVNAYTQYNFGGRLEADYKAIRGCFKKIKEQFSGKKIGIPKIGAGLAGGDWEKISSIIEEELKGEDLTCVQYEGV